MPVKSNTNEIKSKQKQNLLEEEHQSSARAKWKRKYERAMMKNAILLLMHIMRESGT